MCRLKNLAKRMSYMLFLNLLLFLMLVSCKGNGTGNNNNNNNSQLSKIEIFSITVDGRAAEKDKTIGVQNTEAQLRVKFKEHYKGLTLTVNKQDVTINNDLAAHKLTNITETATPVVLVAKAKGKADETYSFNIRKVGLARIEELIFIGKGLNPSAAGSADEDKLAYSADATKPNPLTKINNDGTHKIGITTSYMMEVQVKVDAKDSKARKLKVENTTNNKNATTGEVANNILKTQIPLKVGTNNLIVTYEEDGSNYVSYRLVVEYKEPDYAPIAEIEFNGRQRYNNAQSFEKLKTGTEVINVTGETKLSVSVKMKKLWYDEQGWTLKIDGRDVDKSEFKEVGKGENLRRELKTEVDILKNDRKQVKIIFANPNKNAYSVEYKIIAIHNLFHKLDTLTLVEENTKNYLKHYSFESFLKTEGKENHYNLDIGPTLSDWSEKVLFFFETGSETVKYAVLNQEKEPATITSEWKNTNKRTLKYNKAGEEVERTANVGECTIEHGVSYLYVSLEGNGLTVYYRLKMNRKKEKTNDTDLYPAEPEKITLNKAEKPIPNNSPFGEWGLIKFKPKNPRAKIKIVAPKEQILQLNGDRSCFEYKIALTKELTTVKYKVISEDDTKESAEKEIKFEKKQVVKGVRFVYANGKFSVSYNNMKDANIKNGEYYIPVEKKEVEKANGQFSISIAFDEDVTFSSADLTAEIKDEDLSNIHAKAKSYSVDVSEVLTGTKKTYTVTFMRETKSAGTTKIHLFKANEDINGITVWQEKAMEFPDNEYIFNKKIAYDKVELLLEIQGDKNEDKGNTKRKVVFEYDGHTTNENEVKIRAAGGIKPVFSFYITDFALPASGASKEVKVKYYKDKTTSDPAKEYTLKIITP